MAGPVTTYPGLLEVQRPAGDLKPWPTVLILGALWLLTLNQLRVEWAINPQYTYGWTVPFLALYLFGERWKDRPATAPVRSVTWLTVFVAIVAFMLLPLRVIQEASPDWRLIYWAMAGSAAAITLSVVYRAGGRQWLRHFAAPVLFVLIAVPWPVPLEQILVQGLMRLVARICVEALSFFAIPAVQHGNVIEIATGKVGVEEACSGVRSLQTTLMASLFLGELFRFTVIRRILLLVSGLFLAFACNLARSFYLVWISVHEGTGAALKVHDKVGIYVLLASLVGLALLCALLRPRGVEEVELDPEARDAAPWQPRFAPRSMIIAGACWLLVIEAGTELWYRSHEGSRTFAPWSVRWPENAPGFRDLPLGEAVRAMLRYDQGKSVVWNGADGIQWSMIFLRWMPGRASAQLARSHGPEVCLAANGAVLHTDLGVKTMRVANLDLPMHGYIFNVRGAPLFVYYCLWEDQVADDGPKSTRESMTSSGRLRGVLKGRRNTGQQVIEVAVAGMRDPAEAEAATTRMLEEAIVP
ncbi:MAG: exosortase/archaeosortase family protein [Chthoniobacteraceae bacterium]